MEDEIRENNEGNHEAGSENNSNVNSESSEPKVDNDVSQSVSSRPKIDNNPDVKNPWKMATIVLGIAVIVLLFMTFKGGITGNVISEGAAGEKFLAFAEAQGADVELIEINDKSGMYEISVLINGQEAPLYVTKDGEFFAPGLVPLIIDDTLVQSSDNTQQPPQDVIKSDKPKVELFVWGYCPYGVQAQGPLTDVVSLLGDSADFEVVLYYDGHGAYETQQNKIQACMQDVAPDKYWAYSRGFVDNIYPKCSVERSEDCDKTESVKLMKSLGINDVSIMSCVDTRGADLIAEHSARAQAYGVTGSPSLVINGMKVNAARNADGFKGAVCGAFNNAPSECGTALDSSAAATAGNC